MSGGAALAVDDLHVEYGGAGRVLKGVSLRVPAGSVVALLGNNGAGKTTVLRAVSGTLRLHRGAVRQGTVTWDGAPVTGTDAAEIVRRGIVQVPEGRHVFGRLTVEENLRVGGGVLANRTERARERERVLTLFPALTAKLGTRAGMLSGGEQQMLAIGRALMGRPRLLLLDEPSLGLAPRIIAGIAAAVDEIHRQGTGVLLVEQNSAMALSLATTAYVLDVGRVSLSGRVGEDIDAARVRELYMGVKP
ncbi:ABC transporter ATP-binding protein [Actinomadura darangshiensis]|uniref:ABC transporter ATP-binding protein n=1 Tax=Actinomadura darangshiensis TaxID=705336 RepID=A0A4R5C5I8_9ACTN|nr:ABC transporter ATP-binding protein [Actinomadura darangshiensis]TDD92132.1 ABC transporter ATP-binding protein [Actinomadura darangshiensis]